MGEIETVSGDAAEKKPDEAEMQADQQQEKEQAVEANDEEFVLEIEAVSDEATPKESSVTESQKEPQQDKPEETITQTNDEEFVLDIETVSNDVADKPSDVAENAEKQQQEPNNGEEFDLEIETDDVTDKKSPAIEETSAVSESIVEGKEVSALGEASASLTPDRRDSSSSLHDSKDMEEAQGDINQPPIRQESLEELQL